MPAEIGTRVEPRTRRASFGDLGVTTKILAAVGAAAVVALAVGLIGLVSLANASDSAQLIYHSNVASIKSLANIRYSVTQARVDLANQALSTDAPSTRKFAAAFEDDLRAFDEAMTAYQASEPASNAALIDELQSNWGAYQDVAENKLLPAGDRNALDE
jgi:methyl-accepting chemotaxis protein